MTSIPNPAPLSSGITGPLARLRARIRGYVWLEGLALAIAWLGLAFWITLLIDWAPVKFGSDEPSLPWRILMIAIAVVAFVGLVVWMVLRRSFTSLPDRSMAVLLERRFNTLQDSLLTTVEMKQRPDHAAEFNPHMLAYTYQQAEARTGEVPLGLVFNRLPLVRNLVAAVLLLSSIGVFAVAAPNSFKIWANRYILLKTDVFWPRYCRISIDGNKVVKIARGDDYTLTVKADTRFEVPKVVRIVFRADGGSSGRENMVRQGVPRDGFQLFTFTFRGRLESVNFDVIGGDHRVRDYRLEVVDSPTAQLALYCEFPEYMVDTQAGINTPREIPGSGIVQLPQGTKVTVRAKANKPLTEVQVVYPNDKGEDQRKPMTFPTPKASFEFTLDSLDFDSTLLFSLLDADGIRSRDPLRLALVATPDEIPQVEMRLHGISDAVTAEVRIPAEGQILDDHGVVKTWFEYGIDDLDPEEVLFGRLPKRGTELLFVRGKDEEVLDIREVIRARNMGGSAGTSGTNDAAPADDPTKPTKSPANAPGGGDETKELQLRPGQRLFVSIKAQDACTLGNKPRIGTSRRYELRVVTPEELRGLLAAREINLRQRFERIVEEVTGGRDSLTDIVLRVEDLRGGKLPAIPGDPEAGKELTPKRLRALGYIRAQRCQQGSAKNTGETMEIALQFDDIRDELLNNRLYTQEYEQRLKDGIADPLRDIAERMFPELDKRLQRLEGYLDEGSTVDDAARMTALQQCQEQSDAIIVKMHEVLAKMLEFEAYNRALELLREIVAAQQRLNKITKEIQLQNIQK